MSPSIRNPQRSPRTRIRCVLPTAGAVALAFLLSACGSSGSTASSSGSNFVTGSDGISFAKQGTRATAPTLSGKTVDGQMINTDDYKGKIVVLNVWGSWCNPCRAEASNLAKVARDLADEGVQFVGINTRDAQPAAARAFEKEFDVPYPSLHDPTGKLILRFPKGSLSPQAIPTTIIIDRKGKIAARALTALSEQTLRRMLKPVLAEQ
ncbi:TlpA family protein disulfide reductase [Streptomyces nigra]|uniref:TlpA family protein disulfide reductase n=1 Tax=Streptomyces nigra TaxID=1827580 RepID=UPI0036B2E7BF